MIRLLLLFVVIGFLSGVSSPTYSNETTETRYCGTPKRDANGTIVRSSRVYWAFRRLYPCPATGLRTGACPGWSVNHDLPLACGGCDSVSNSSWMRNDVKKLHDSYERKIYGGYFETPACTQAPVGGLK